MKNLPDKIYLNFGEITKEEFEESDYKEFCKIDEYAVTYCEDKVYDCDVEYIRKDAFVEKACEWLRTHSEVDYFELIPEANYCGAGNLNKKKMIEDFEKYLKK